MALEGYSAATDFNTPIIEEFRANGGKVGGMFGGMTLALLTTVGACTGLPRTSPVGWLEIDGESVIVASAGGAPNDPAWYHNLRANPWVTVEVRTEKFQALAYVADGEERDQLWQKIVAIAPGFADYQKQTTRQIPVVMLRAQEGPDGTRLRGLGAGLEEVHDWLRQELRNLRKEVDDYLARRTHSVNGLQPAPELTTKLSSHCLTFCKALAVHHTGETNGAFPVLEQRFPALAPILDKLRAEHVVVARLHGEIEALVAELSTRDVEKLRGELERLTNELEQHFRYEEETLVAALNAMGPAPARRPE